jgi:hypothetical protein
MRKRILVLKVLFFIYFHAFSQTDQDTLYLLKPKCRVDSLIDNYLGKYNPNYTDTLQWNLINSVHKEFGKSFVIIDCPLEIEEYERFFNIYLNLTQDYKPTKEFHFFDFDSLLISRQIRKTIIIYSDGFKRSKKDYNKESAKGLLISILTLGMYVVVPIESHTNIFFTIYDHSDRKVLYFKRKMGDGIDPVLIKDIDKQIHNNYLNYLKIINPKND